MDYGRKKMEGRRKRKGEGREGWEEGKEGKRPKKGRIDFLLVSCVFFLGVALLYINKRKRVFICVWLLAEDFPRN
jgi:hypothetical protein